MKTRRTYLFVLLISVFALAPAIASTESISVQQSDLHYDLPTSTASYPNHRIGSAVESKVFPNQNNSGSTSQEPGTQIRHSPDAAMNGTVIPVCDAIQSLIAVLHLPKPEGIAQTVDLPGHQVLFRILFRVIISPNAP